MSQRAVCGDRLDAEDGWAVALPEGVLPVVVAARACDLAGYRRIALFGAGRHSSRIVRQPWTMFDIRVVGLVDDDAGAVARLPSALRGLRVWTPGEVLQAATGRPSDYGPAHRPRGASAGRTVEVDAVVVSSDAHEAAIVARHAGAFARAGVPLIPIYGGTGNVSAAALVERLVRYWGLERGDAAWLAANRTERHDATVPMLPPARTELHLARYGFAAGVLEQRGCARVVDCACGTGYGSALLGRVLPGAWVVGVDVDERTVGYAQRRFGSERVTFVRGRAERSGLADGCADAVVSFETIEHVAETGALVGEFARLLRPAGTLILSTPNEGGLTEHHVHSFDRGALESALALGGFGDIDWWGQTAERPAPERLGGTVSEGEMETLVVVARRA